MCCETHDLRDFLARFDGRGEALAELLAPSDGYRCRCTELGRWGGQRCERKADREDLLCPWCRSTDHQMWYTGQLRDAGPAVRAYYEERGGNEYGGLPSYREFRESLAVSGEGYTVSGPGGGRTDYSYRPAGSSPLSFRPRDIGQMQAQSRLAKGPVAFEFDAMTTADTFEYLRRKYGA